MRESERVRERVCVCLCAVKEGEGGVGGGLCEDETGTFVCRKRWTFRQRMELGFVLRVGFGWRWLAFFKI